MRLQVYTEENVMCMRSYLSFLLVTMVTLSLTAQQVNGHLTDKYGLPIMYAQIVNVTNSNHTHSDIDGRFRLQEANTGDTLQISHIAYEEFRTIIKDTDIDLIIELIAAPIDLDEILISPDQRALNILTDIDIKVNPVNSSQDVLRQVPGLFIGQHAGGGKAEQIFLRGFDIDHGTDITISSDGLPVNMVSHAHGQGYADLHFIIPETIDNIDFGKGPYYADQGNFNTAGFVNFNSKNRLESNSIKLETGIYNTNRFVGMFNTIDTKTTQSYIATEYSISDGPFESSQNFNRINAFGKLSTKLTDNDKLTIAASYFTSTWDASGQIPERAVKEGLITRFGAIDDTEGGVTGRSNVSLKYDKILNKKSSIRNSLYYSKYDFELFSNFTFFLEDPINGDQIKQKEERDIFGFDSEYFNNFFMSGFDGELKVGLTIRNDQSKDNELSNTLNKTEVLNRIQKGNVNETNAGVYTSLELKKGKFLLNPVIRLDQFKNIYYDALVSNQKTQSVNASIISPKFNLQYNHSHDLQAYVKLGKGFHSNDTRAVVAQDGDEILPAAYGYDIGIIWKPIPRLVTNLAYWSLYLEQEFVYVGDAGIIEPSGESQRNGVDLSIRYQPINWLFFNFDVNYTKARSLNTEIGQSYVPLAPKFTLVNGISVKHPLGISGGIHTRHIGDRPANEDNSIVAKGYTVVDMNANYEFKNFGIGFQIQNLFNTEWNETQFATESRLRDEPLSVEEIHFTPGTPFFFKGIFEFRF